MTVKEVLVVIDSLTDKKYSEIIDPFTKINNKFFLIYIIRELYKFGARNIAFISSKRSKKVNNLIDKFKFQNINFQNYVLDPVNGNNTLELALRKHPKLKTYTMIRGDTYYDYFHEKNKSDLLSDPFFRLSGEDENQIFAKKMLDKNYVLLDRDNTINLDQGYTHKPNQFKAIYKTIDFLQRILTKKTEVLFFTNQSGIGRGYYKDEDFWRFSEHVNKFLAKNEITVSGWYYCPHDPTNEICGCRKPKLGMYRQALEVWDINPSKSLFIGDADSDKEFADRIGIKDFYFPKNL